MIFSRESCSFTTLPSRLLCVTISVWSCLASRHTESDCSAALRESQRRSTSRYYWENQLLCQLWDYLLSSSCSDVKEKCLKGEAVNPPRMPIKGLPRSASCILFSSSQRPSLPLHFRYIKPTPSNLRLHNAIPGGGLLGGGKTKPKDFEESSLSTAVSRSHQDTLESSEIVILSDSSITSCTTMDSPQSR